MNVKASAVCLMLLWPTAAFAQAGGGFAGLGVQSDAYSQPQPGVSLRFPEDHGAHPGYRIEWWYVTALLTTKDGREFGAQWTLFRSALTPHTKPQIWMAHAAVTTERNHYSAERFARGDVGQAGVESGHNFDAWLDDWRLWSGDAYHAPSFSPLSVRARDAKFGFDLKMRTEKPIVLQGDQGYSIKSESGQSSYYYSQPFYVVTGVLLLENETLRVSGRAWLDREWSSQPLASDQIGWDWFSLHLDQGANAGAKLTLFRLRHADGSAYFAGNWIHPDGRSVALAADKIHIVPLSGSAEASQGAPTSWRLRVADYGVDIKTTPLNPNAWMDTAISYWEGPIRFSGSHSGAGYLEMTGYDKPIAQ